MGEVARVSEIAEFGHLPKLPSGYWEVLLIDYQRCLYKAKAEA